MSTLNPLQKYLIGFAFWMSLYMIAIVFNGFYFRQNTPVAPLVYILAVMPALPIGGTIWVILRYMDKCDEYMRALLSKRFILATGLTLFICTVYGFLENYAGLAHIYLFYVWVLFWFCYGVITAFLAVTKQG